MAGESERGQENAPRRRPRNLAHAGHVFRRALSEAAGRRGFAEPEVLTRWEEVAGAHLARLCRPVRVAYGAQRAIGATLVVAAAGARAPEIEHLAPRILERVNGFYGYRAVTRLRIVQEGPAGGLAEEAATFDGAPPARRSPGREETARAAAMTGAVRDPELRAALARLGAWALTRPARGGTGAAGQTEES